MSSAVKDLHNHKGNKKDPTGNEDENEKSSSKKRGPKTALDVQRSKLEKLMKNPDKPVNIPTPRTDKRDPNKAPEFVYNVMGSSAGAGSGEFHVYRQLRRKEMLRQGVMKNEKEKDQLNEAYHQKLDENEKSAQEKTDKKRQKRLKKKENAKKRKKGNNNKDKESSSSSENEDEEENKNK